MNSQKHAESRVIHHDSNQNQFKKLMHIHFLTIKVIGKLQKAGGGAPGREPAVSESEKNAMMAHYFKQQEEQKRLAENSEDDYLHSSWADPKQLQRSLRGQSGAVKAPGVR
jgi:Cilia- and flagella-associated protein 298